MAVIEVKIIHSTLNQALDYYTNRKDDFGKVTETKDGEEIKYIHCDHCTYETAELEWDYVRKKAVRDLEGSKHNVLGYHIIQSFAPGEVTAEEAHAIGKEFAEKLFGGKYQYMVTTHLDTHCYHNHIAFCSVDYNEHRKYRYKKFQTIKEWRSVSDEICKEHNLNVIKEQKSKYKNTKERTQHKPHREQLRRDIDKVLQNADTYEEFLNGMADLGYEIKRTPKYTSFKHEDWDRFARLNAKTVGEDYTEDAIRERIITKRPPIPKRMRKGKRRITLIIDIENNIKVQSSKGYENWARIHNLQEEAKTLNFLIEHDIGTYEEMDAKVAELKDTKEKYKNDMKEMDAQIHDLKEQLSLIKSYNDAVQYAAAYNKSADRKKYKAEHQAELDQFKVLDKALREKYPNGKLPKSSKMQQELDELLKQREELYKKYTDIDNDIDSFSTAKHNIDMFMKRQKESERSNQREQTEHTQASREYQNKQSNQTL